MEYGHTNLEEDSRENFHKKEKKIIKAQNIELAKISKRFDDSLNEIEGMFDIPEQIRDTKPNFVQDVCRSQIVFLESALDLYMHEIVTYGMVNIFNNESNWQEVKGFNSFHVSMRFLKKVYNKQENIKDIVSEVGNSIGHYSYVKYDVITDQLEMIGIKPEKLIGNNFLREKVKAANDRRTVIVHASDRKANGEKKYINEKDVKDYVDSIKELKEIIQKYIEEK